MSEYNFREIEKKWQKRWSEKDVYKVEIDTTKPKFYVLDMFPYPSGAGLHVGHPLGYIGTDIVSRYKRQKGFNVLHPMGFDAFGLPAEQYAIQTGQHPAKTTKDNILQYKSQLRNIGFCYDWSREVQTCDPKYYKWTQWIFMQLFNSWYNNDTNKAEPIDQLVDKFTKSGNKEINAACSENTLAFDQNHWNSISEKEKSEILNNYRLTYLDDALVNWCPELGTVLANDEIKDGFSERGGYPVERKKMKQWMMRITAYADRLLNDLAELDWSTSMKDMQSNWIGKSSGCELNFKVKNIDLELTAFTTRPDTIYGVTYMVIAPEHELVAQLTTATQKNEIDAYVEKSAKKSERDRISETKTVSGVFTGSYAINPFTNEEVPIWIADYVLAGYGTGIVMAVPSSDDRDFKFAKHYNLPVRCVIEGSEGLENPTEIKYGKLINSQDLNGLNTDEAIEFTITKAEKENFGVRKVNFRIRDAVFSRQRYWGEPVPVHFEDGIPKLIDEKDLPLVLPPIDEYKPTEQGDPPLGRAIDWSYNGNPYELTTMPGWAGSSWYFLRYMDATNENEFVSKKAVDYWENVDLYVGGTEHATGHLLYSRFWNKFLFDLGLIKEKEPFKKLVNQGMIQGKSSLAYRIKGENKFVSYNLRKEYDCSPIHVDISMVDSDNSLDLEKFKKWRKDLSSSEFILEDGKFFCGSEVEKMSKRLYNVVNPDDVISENGADTLRLYEMFLGPIEQSKPWDTHGIDGVYRFLRKFWNSVIEGDKIILTDDKPSKDAYKVLHKTIKKVEEDINKLSFNTCVSAFMICINELNGLKCTNREIYEDLIKLIAPFTPHFAEELWEKIGHNTFVINEPYPTHNEEYLKENSFEYPIMINGKLRVKIEFPSDKNKAEMESEVLSNEVVKKWIDGNAVKKIIIVPNKIINVVI